ncbi:MAG TPA: peptidylprolyl isomerase [Desulfosalsimonadaceae bacterium]|nr:peptidylprolyl isomerase [Desulfosalsimonadaceae bacterium]
MRFFPFKTAAGVLLAVFLLAAPVPEPATAAETVDRIVAIVNNDIIRLQELREKFQPIAEKIRDQNYSSEKEKELLYKNREKVLNHLIDQTLADQVIEKRGISVSEAEIDEAIERVKSANYYTEQDLRRSLRLNDMSMVDYRQNVRRQILQGRLVNREVKSSIIITEEDIKEYYDNHPEKYQGNPEYRLKNIFKPCRDPASCKKMRQEMEEALAALEQGGAFEAVARDYSESGNAEKGGDLGTFSLEDLQKKIRSAVRKLAPGEFSGIVETRQGLHIFYLAEIVESEGKPLESVSGKIRRRLYEQAVDKKYQEWISNLREDAHIQIIR